MMGLKQTGNKEVLSMWISETENASLWFNVLSDIKVRGV